MKLWRDSNNILKDMLLFLDLHLGIPIYLFTNHILISKWIIWEKSFGHALICLS